jgi:hypothetical protein
LQEDLFEDFGLVRNVVEVPRLATVAHCETAVFEAEGLARNLSCGGRLRLRRELSLDGDTWIDWGKARSSGRLEAAVRCRLSLRFCLSALDCAATAFARP